MNKITIIILCLLVILSTITCIKQNQIDKPNPPVLGDIRYENSNSHTDMPNCIGCTYNVVGDIITFTPFYSYQDKSKLHYDWTCSAGNFQNANFNEIAVWKASFEQLMT
jgi:hypothetical protein